MKIAFSSNAFTNYSLIDSIKMISQVGYGGIEIMSDVPHAYPPHLSQDLIAELKKTLKENNLEVSNLNAFTLFALGDTYHPSWIETSQEKREARINHTINCIDLAYQLGARNISVEPGGPVLLQQQDPSPPGPRLPPRSSLPSNENMSNQRAFQLFKQGIEKILPHAEKKKVKILIEPEPGLLLENSKQFLEFIKNFNSKYLKLNFDMGHFYCVNEDPSLLIMQLGEYIEHFHMADIKNRVHNHLIPGLGDIDFKKVFKAIKEISYDGFITLELYPYKENPVEAATLSFEYLQTLDYL